MPESHHTPKKGPNSGIKHPPRRGRKNGPLLVLEYLRQGLGPSDLWKKDLVPKRTVKRSLSELRSVGLIKKVGYGTWEIVEQDNDKQRRGQIVHRVTAPITQDKGPKKGPKLKPDMIRAHGIVATVKVNRAKFLTWNDRHYALKARKIPYVEIPQGQRIKVLDVEKVWLTNKSIVYYLPYSWFGETAHECAAKIMEDVIRLTLRLERMLGIDTLKIHGSYWIKFSRQHDSLIKNALAQMYNHPRQKIQFRDEIGQWALIDNSFNLEEFEAVRGEREFQPINPYKPILPQIRENDQGAREHIRKVQNFVNGVKETGITPDFILERFADTATQIKEAHGQLAYYAENLRTHVGAVNNLSEQAQENAKTTVSLREAVQRLAESLQSQTWGDVSFQRPLKLAPKKVKKEPPVYLATVPEKKNCALCGARAMIPGNKDLCLDCESLVSKRKRTLETASLDNYID